MLSRFLFALAVVTGLGLTAQSFALSPDEVKQAYDGCITFLAMPHSKQVEVAKTSGYSLDKCLWGCRLMKSNGLEKSLRLEAEYDRQTSTSAPHGHGTVHGVDPTSPNPMTPISPSSPSSGIDTGFKTCGPDNECSAGEKCINGTCH